MCGELPLVWGLPPGCGGPVSLLFPLASRAEAPLRPPSPPRSTGIFGFYFYDVSAGPGSGGRLLRRGPTAAAA